MKKLLVMAIALSAAAAFAQPVEVARTATTAPAMTRPASPEGAVTLTPELGGTIVNFDISEMPLKQALLQYTAATKMKVVLPDRGRPAGGATPVVDRPTKLGGKMPMYEGLVKMLQPILDEQEAVSGQICPEGEQALRPFGGRLIASKGFLIVASRLERIADYQRKPEQTEQFLLHLQVFAEPGFRIFAAPAVVVPKVATDSDGNSLVPAAPLVVEATTKPSVDPRNNYSRVDWYLETTVQLTKVKATGDRIKVIRGTIPVGFINRMQVLRLTAPGTKSETIDGITMGLTHKEAASYDTLTANFKWDARTDPELSKEIDTFMAASRFRVLDAEGHAYPRTTGGASWGGGSRSMSGTIPKNRAETPTTPKIGPPAEVMLEVPMEMKVLEVEFEFKDLPMP